jgi:hypothetical protein
MAQITDLDTHRAFWRDQIAAKCTDIESFTELEMNEALNTIKSPGLNSPILVMLRPEFRSIDERSINVQRTVSWGFFILKRATKKQDRAEIKTLQNDCHQICEEIIGRLDYLNEEKEFFGKYHATATEYEPITGLFDNHHGIQCFGQFITNSPIRHDATKWT